MNRLWYSFFLHLAILSWCRSGLIKPADLQSKQSSGCTWLLRSMNRATLPFDQQEILLSLLTTVSASYKLYAFARLRSQTNIDITLTTDAQIIPFNYGNKDVQKSYSWKGLVRAFPISSGVAPWSNCRARLRISILEPLNKRLWLLLLRKPLFVS